MGPLLPSLVFSKLPWESLEHGGLPLERGPSKFQWPGAQSLSTSHQGTQDEIA